MVTYYLIVRHHVRRSSLRSPIPAQLSVSALDCSFSFVFFSVQTTNLQTFKHFRPNSFPHNSLSDPHPLNPIVSILCRNSGGRGPDFPCHPERSEGSAFSLLPYVSTSLLHYVVTSIFLKAQLCPPNSTLLLAPPSTIIASTSAPKASVATC